MYQLFSPEFWQSGFTVGFTVGNSRQKWGFCSFIRQKFSMDGNKGTHDISMFVPYPNNQILWSWFGPSHFIVHLMSDALGIFLYSDKMHL